MTLPANLATYGRNEGAITARESQVPLADFDDGLNLGASCAPGLGISTGIVNPKLSDWSVADQFGVNRTPQQSQHLGITGLQDGSDNPLLGYAVQVADYEAVDINDEAHFIEATLAAVPGADAGGGVLNRTDETLTIGDRIWGTLPVA
jgi:hypothetical protein